MNDDDLGQPSQPKYSIKEEDLNPSEKVGSSFSMDFLKDKIKPPNAGLSKFTRSENSFSFHDPSEDEVFSIEEVLERLQNENHKMLADFEAERDRKESERESRHRKREMAVIVIASCTLVVAIVAIIVPLLI